MPYKDKEKRYEAIRKSVAKKPELYQKLNRNNQRKPARIGYQLERRYGINFLEHQAMVEAQQGKCKICKKEPKPSRIGRSGLYVDHNHITGKVRALLCARCNTLIGHMEKPDWETILQEARNYLENHS